MRNRQAQGMRAANAGPEALPKLCRRRLVARRPVPAPRQLPSCATSSNDIVRQQVAGKDDGAVNVAVWENRRLDRKDDNPRHAVLPVGRGPGGTWPIEGYSAPCPDRSSAPSAVCSVRPDQPTLHAETRGAMSKSASRQTNFAARVGASTAARPAGGMRSRCALFMRLAAPLCGATAGTSIKTAGGQRAGRGRRIPGAIGSSSTWLIAAPLAARTPEVAARFPWSLGRGRLTHASPDVRVQGGPSGSICFIVGAARQT